MNARTHLPALMLVLLCASLPQPALAYIGPGVGLGAIAVTFALIFGFALLIVGLVWYPIKRRLKRRGKGARDNREEGRGA